MLVWFVSLSAEYPPVATIVATGVQQVDIDFNPFTENRFNSCPFTRDQPQGSSAAARLRQPLLLDFLPRPAALLLVRCCPLRRCRGCSHDFLCLVTQPALPSVSFRSRSLSAFAAHVRAASAPAAPCPSPLPFFNTPTACCVKAPLYRPFPFGRARSLPLLPM